jgi:hypothetical protein
MCDNAARRREQQIQFANSRLAERSDVAIERSDVAIERSDVAIERSDAAIERNGGSSGCHANDVAAETFRRATSLGGHLVVAFIAPVGASNSRSRVVPSTRPWWSQADADAAEVFVRILLQQRTASLKPPVSNPTRPTAAPPGMKF